MSKAAQQLRVGDRFEISQAQGDFVLHQGQQSALLIASGSGITAIYSLLKQAVAQNLKRNSCHCILTVLKCSIRKYWL